MDLVGLDQVILEVAAVFGRFVKYACTMDQSREETEVGSLSLSHCLSLAIPLSLSLSQQKSLPFSVSVQHVKNADTMVQCEECEMWSIASTNLLLPKDEPYKASWKTIHTLAEHSCLI